MKLLKEITEKDLGIGEAEQLGENYRLRKSARGIVLDEVGNIAVQHLTTYTFHKLPGGGVDQGETINEALLREVKEEVGCDCEIVQELGMVIEYRNSQNLLHISYGFVAQVKGNLGTPALESKEIEEGQETLWLPPTEVLSKMKSDVPGKLSGNFILAREIAFLETYLKYENA